MPNPNSRCSSVTGLALTAQFEGLRLTAYQDAAGVWTIGHGHTGHDVHPGLTITPQTAMHLLQQDLACAAATVNRLATVALTQNQFDALVDFVFNVGAGSFARSTLLRELNAANFAAAAAQFVRWSYVAGATSSGLTRRRQAEASLFQSPDKLAPKSAAVEVDVISASA